MKHYKVVEQVNTMSQKNRFVIKKAVVGQMSIYWTQTSEHVHYNREAAQKRVDELNLPLAWEDVK